MADEGVESGGEGADFWRAHIRAWRRSEVSRAAYCREHGLAARRFDHWVARLREEFRRPVKGVAADGRARRTPPPRAGACGEGTGFVPVMVSAACCGEPAEGIADGAETAAEGGGARVEVVLGSAVVRVISPVDEAMLRAVLGAVRATA